MHGWDEEASIKERIALAYLSATLPYFPLQDFVGAAELDKLSVSLDYVAEGYVGTAMQDLQRERGVEVGDASVEDADAA